jgi:curli production assembly/transport component CsgF
MKSVARLACVAFVAVPLSAMPAAADDLTYSPVNPSFGGNPLNSSHLLGLANAQRTATARDARTPGSGSGDPGTTPGQSDADLFVRQLQGRLLSALASQVTEAIFGAQPQDSGTVQFGDTTVTFERTLDSIRLTITDAFGETTIIVPQLVTSNPSGQQQQMFNALPSGGDLVTNTGLGGGDLSQGLGGGDLTAGGLN